MGVATGGMGERGPRLEILGNVPPEIASFKEIFGLFAIIFRFFQYFLNKVGETRPKIGIRGG